MPTGWDRELVIKTIFKAGVDKVCLVSVSKKKDHVYSQADLVTSEVNDVLIKELSKFTEIEFLEVNYVDFNDIVSKVNLYLNKHKEHELIINISTGSHMVAAALLFVAYLNHVNVEYSLALGHNPKVMDLVRKGENLHQGLSQIIKIPSLPFSITFSVKEKKLLMLLKKNKMFSVADFLDGAKGNMENRLRSEFHYLCKKLEKQGFVKIYHQGKKFKVELTEFGALSVENL